MKAKSDAIEKLKTKAEIIQALKDSFTQAHTYVDAITPDNAFMQTANGTRGAWRPSASRTSWITTARWSSTCA